MSGSNFVSLLIDCGFRASFPLGIAWAVTRLLPRSSAATRHAPVTGYLPSSKGWGFIPRRTLSIECDLLLQHYRTEC
jgi:hypothetical protein